MNKPNIKTVTLTILAGQKAPAAAAKLSVPKGKVVFMAVATAPAPETIINVTTLENNQTLVDPIDVRFYDGSVGSFQQRGRMLPYNGGSNIEVEAKAVTAVAADTTIQVVFEIWQEHTMLNSAWDQTDPARNLLGC